MRLLVKLPSRSRPTKLHDVLKKYVEYASDISNIQFLISLDQDDITVTTELINDLMRDIPNCKICIGSSKSKIYACNRDMDKVSNYDIIILASDDMIPQIHGYDAIIREQMIQYFPDTDGVLWFNDGYRGQNLNTLCILGKRYYDRFGYIYHPGYKSFYCDNEFTEVANRLGRQVYFDFVIIKHEHPANTSGEYDDLYVKNDAYSQKDHVLYTLRRLTNFSR